ncbi:MAG: nucleoside triphosphate pyrophosphohydrolase [Victivallaceae bacterium]|jgi:MazG family protein
MDKKEDQADVSAEALLKVMEKLRSPEGCPWDRQQTHETLKLYLAEECAELIDAIDNDDQDGICEELGDVLMNIVFNCVIANEKGHFHFNDVLAGIISKMIRRHPHVFGDAKAESADDVVIVWEKIKQREKQHRAVAESVLDGIPRSLSALLTARAAQRKAAKYGFDWSSEAQIMEKIDEELAELKAAMTSGNQEHVDEEIGDVLFSMVNLIRFRDRATPEDLLNAATRKFKTRFQYIEKELKAAGKTLPGASLEEMEMLWQEAKRNQ